MHVEFRTEEGAIKRIKSEGPISRFNSIGGRSLYIRQYGGIKHEDSKHREWSKTPEILMHMDQDGRLSKITVVFGGKIFHYAVQPPGILSGDAYRVLRALEAAAKRDLGPLRNLAEKWRGETEIRLKDRKGKSEIRLKIHAADIQDFLERYTHLRLGIERQTSLEEHGIRIRRKP